MTSSPAPRRPPALGDFGRPARPVGATGSGRLVAAAGPVVRAADLRGVAIGEVVRVGPHGLLGEVIHLEPGSVTVEVYEETAGLQVGDPVIATGAPLRAWLGPGLLGSTYDGLQRPLDRLAAGGAVLLRPGLGATDIEAAHPTVARVDSPETSAALGDRRWEFEPERRARDLV